MATFMIIGAGQAGAWLAKTLRKQDANARIVLIGDEDVEPYERPPLSKDVLKGDAQSASTTVLTNEAANDLDVELWLGETAGEIDRQAQCVRCESGREVVYSKLFLATGSRVRTLSLPELPEDRVFYLRTLRDAERLREAIDRHHRVIVIGGGWIGLEVAAAARGMDKQVSVIEMAPRLCARAVPPIVSEYLQGLHVKHGVDVRVGTTATLAWTGSGIEAITDDETAPLTAEIVVVATGIVPNVELASNCGLAVDNGIVVDEYGRTSDPNIFSVGDVTNHPNHHFGTRVRLESWGNAQNQAIAVARAALGTDEAYVEIPWFWSDQYDVNLQILGLPPVDIGPERRGDPVDGKCVWFFWRGGQIVSAVGVNAPREIRIVKKWMQEGLFPEPAAVLDESNKLQKLARS